jgi:cytochrome c biogenesis protein CcmG/thiol:disulfide interchange protein DsbE
MHRLFGKILSKARGYMPQRLAKLLMFIGIFDLLLLGPAFLSTAKVLNDGDKAPIFALDSVQGPKVDLAQYIGSAVIVVGLFHICEPCMEQAMEMETLFQSMKNKKVFLVGVNASGDSKAAIMDYLNKFPQRVSFPYLLDPTRTVEGLFNIRATPMVYIIDRQGVIRFKGSSVPAEVLEKEVLKLLS